MTVSRRVTAGMGALVGALLLALVPLPSGPAGAAEAPVVRAADTEEDSAVTKTGKKGPYDDFSDLKVTVHQTRNLRAQGVQVTWTSHEMPPSMKYMNFLQIMQCWGDGTAGPEREQCEFGANNAGERFMGLRALPTGADPQETKYTEDPGGGNPFVPFRPVVGDQTDSPTDWTYFTNNDTNAQPWLRTRQDGTGEAVFEVKTALEAPHLGCGEVDLAAGRTTPRRCWLVVVPRGTHDPDGSSDVGTGLRTSGLSQSNWDQRIVFPMDFGPVGNTCAADKVERRVIGAELLTDAITSWQTRLCSGADSRFTFSQAGEDYARGLIENPTASSPGMGITVAPVEGGTDVVHAPVAVSALTVGFFWEDGDAGQVHDLKLNPRLLAKLLTGSYPYDVRLVSFEHPVPDHLEGNALSIIVDPEFRKLNPYFDRDVAPQLGPDGILLQAANSDVNSLVWRYLQSDADAREFLEGKPDPWGTKVNPSYQGLELDKTAPLDFPKADPTETEVSLAFGDGATGKIKYGQQERSPYSSDLHNGALRIRRGASGATFVPAQDPSSPSGVKLVVSDAVPGSRKAYGIVDAASASRYGLDVAALPNADGDYVKPTADALLKAVARMPDSAVKGVKAPTPATAKGGAYPLTAVAYAATPLDQPADARRDYARLIRYAAGDGQTAGLAPGELPPGYAPMPKALRDQALAAADQLERGKPAAPGGDESVPAGAGGSGGGTDTAAVGGPAGDSGGTAAGSAGSEGAAGGPGTDAPSASATPGAAASGGGSGPGKSVAAAAGGLTPGEVLGIIRWVLLGVLVTGGAAALAGPVLLRLSARRAATGGSG
ncbi:hypothetical protein KQY30_10695 [Streptomyces sp. GMY02]|uniref:hypothetical protein n=1 Tax=Streptomyces sp. GMY02 TaxID=1333528 RepID=UPI001C2C43B4|nr:hypothetical protein [Streptomyces sp. GMY02]QXE34681.1 hypothetical protein KQY30_10695 [Streptomyces sp. GMY02]